jgi:adenylate cyclase
MERRLTAILAADVVGYSRLMEADEAATLASLKAHHAELIDPEIAGHHGRIVKLMGDGILAEFASVVDAVNCAVGLQRGTAARNAGVPQDRRIVFRIGINLGDVIVDGDDIYGDGVNVAARLEALAEPGGICLSATVHDHIAGKVALDFEDAGAHKVKNLTRPVHVWRWRDQDGEPEVPASGPASGPVSGEPARPALALPSKPSIAVLPFDNLSGDPEQAYFADGIAEDIITALSRIRWFFVIARNSSFAYKGRSVDIRQVSRELGVRYLLEGSVRKAGDRVRLSAQLIDGATGNHIWAERFDRQLVDIFDLQDELTQTIAGAIEPALSHAERQRARAKRPESLDAWDVYQRGMSHLHRRTEVDLAEAAGLFDRAIEADPGLVSAYAAASECCLFQIVGGFAEGSGAQRRTGLALARKAVELDQQDAGARYALGRIYTVRREHELAIPELTRAIDFNPSYAWAHFALGMAYATSGHPEDGIAPIEAAMRLSPHDPYLGQFMVHLGSAYLFMGQPERAREWAERSLGEPNIQWSRYALVISALGHLGRQDAARRAISELLELRPEITVGAVGAWWPISDDHSRDLLLDGLRRAGLPD